MFSIIYKHKKKGTDMKPKNFKTIRNVAAVIFMICGVLMCAFESLDKVFFPIATIGMLAGTMTCYLTYAIEESEKN